MHLEILRHRKVDGGCHHNAGSLEERRKKLYSRLRYVDAKKVLVAADGGGEENFLCRSRKETALKRGKAECIRMRYDNLWTSPPHGERRERF